MNNYIHFIFMQASDVEYIYGDADDIKASLTGCKSVVLINLSDHNYIDDVLDMFFTKYTLEHERHDYDVAVIVLRYKSFNEYSALILNRHKYVKHYYDKVENILDFRCINYNDLRIIKSLLADNNIKFVITGSNKTIIKIY